MMARIVLLPPRSNQRDILGDIVKLKVVSTTAHGAFLDWGLMKDLFVPKSQQISFMRPGGVYL